MIVASAQYNYQYGTQLHYPYSIATVLAYARTVVSDLTLLPTCVRRDQFAENVTRCAAADVLLGSCYVWNWEQTLSLAEAVKSRNPDCKVLLGGPQVPDALTGFRDAYPFVDAVVHNEGEVLGAAALQDCQNDTLRYEYIGPRLNDLSALPSPYLDGTVELLAEPGGHQWVAAWETNRGCPFECYFCDWGSATYTKLRQFNYTRLHHEINWFATRQIPYIDCCDANFGILPRDLQLAEHLRDTKQRTGYPGTFRQSWAKNTPARIIPIARALKDQELLTAVGLALESMDEATLNTVKRKNIKYDDFATLTADFAVCGLPTYTEIIRGLPGETFNSFRAGLATLMESSIGQIYIYNCSVLVNAPMADPAYRRTHAIETVRSPIYLAHSAGHQGRTEYEDIVVSTATMPRAHMERAYLYSWLVLLGHSLGLLDQIPGPSRMAVCEAFLAYAERSHGIVGRELAQVKALITRGYDGHGWGVPWLGLIWPREEESWLRLMLTPDELVDELTRFSGDTDTARRQVAALAARRQDETPLAYATRVMWHGRRRGAFRV